MKYRMLVLFSNPPSHPHLRLDKEDKLIMRIGAQFKARVFLDRQHASNVDDIHALILNGDYDIIHFSGHGSEDGICLEKGDCDSGEVVSAQRLVNVLKLGNKTPILVTMLCCYSGAHIPTLVDAAPFVIAAKGEVRDEVCLSFVEGFYEQLFNDKAISSIAESFERAKRFMESKSHPTDGVSLERRRMIQRGTSFFVESRPRPGQDTLLINLDAVRSDFKKFGMKEEEFCHMLARRISIHRWIFDTRRERALIPVGRTLFGEFSWENANDQVVCNRIVKLRADVPQKLWQVWTTLLNAYNDLAACEYRQAPSPADPSRRAALDEAVQLYQHHVEKFLLHAQTSFKELKCKHLFANVAQVCAHVESASLHLQQGRLKDVVIQLEMALTNYHEIVNELQPPEEPDAPRDGAP